MQIYTCVKDAHLQLTPSSLWQIVPINIIAQMSVQIYPHADVRLAKHWLQHWTLRCV